ncbi:MAG: hypothetical protein HN348_27370, partial [Proteobacteria bacterium]|nr:hypothetical protein [Pseudomonadota bacterium]
NSQCGTVAQSQLEPIIGVGDRDFVDIRVYFPDGSMYSLFDVPTDTSLEMRDPGPWDFPLPEHEDEYIGGARGYHFTAPMDMRISEVRVPADVSSDPQHIQIVSFGASWPVTRTDFTTLAYAGWAAESDWATVNVDISAGERIGILGTRGVDAASQANSYGPVNPWVRMGHTDVQLIRILNNDDLTTGPIGEIYESAAFNIGRVDMRYEARVDMGNPSTSYNYPRGYYFVAPRDLIINSLFVADTVKPNDNQHVQVIRIPDQTEGVSWSTSEFTTLEWLNDVPPTEYAPVRLPVEAGEMIGIIGARGSSGDLSISYRNGPAVENIGGFDTTLYRLYSSVDITQRPVTAIGGQTSPLGRIHMGYEVPDDLWLDQANHDSAYTNGARGYWFTSPANFVMTGFEIPEDVSSDPQYLQIARMGAGWPGDNTDFALLDYTSDADGFISVNIPILEGETIGVIGTRYATQNAVSYGPVPDYDTEMGGLPVTLHRLRTDESLHLGQVSTLTDESGSFKFGRINMTYFRVK